MSCMFGITKPAEIRQKRVAGFGCMFALVLATALSVGFQFGTPAAAATSPTPDTPSSLKAEARRFFIPCSSVVGTEARFCSGDQSIFAADYACAFTGNYSSEKSVALALSPVSSLPLRHVDILSCAWFRVLADHNLKATDHDVLMMKGACYFLTRTGQRLAYARAAAILARIAAFRTTPGARSVCP